MRILLINPPVISVQEPWFDEPDFVRTSLAYLAGYLREHESYELHCIDAKFEKLDFSNLTERIVELNPDIVALTAFTNEIKPAAYVSAKIKAILPNVITVIGGPHFTALPEVTMQEFPTFDMGVCGEGEITFLELCRAIESNLPYENVEGICFRAQNGVKKTPLRKRLLNLNQLPMPAWDLFPKASTYFIQSIRGCPLNCVFCMNHNGKVARKIAVDKVIAEIEFLINYGAKHISFGDELFSVDYQRTHDLLDRMIDLNIGQRVSWDVQTHVAYVDESLLVKMKLANIERLEMGVETGDDQALKRMGKATNKKMILNAFQLARKHGIKTGSFLLIGQPNESVRTILRTIRFGIKINPNEPLIGTMVPYPGTEVSKMASENSHGYQLHSFDWDNYSKQINHSLSFTGLSMRIIKVFQFVAYLAIFIFNFRFIDCFKFILKYRKAGIELIYSIFKNSSRKSLKPIDYEIVTASERSPTRNDMIEARLQWKKVQNEELNHAKTNDSSLLKEQLPLKIMEEN